MFIPMGDSIPLMGCAHFCLGRNCLGYDYYMEGNCITMTVTAGRQVILIISYVMEGLQTNNGLSLSIDEFLLGGQTHWWNYTRSK